MLNNHLILVNKKIHLPSHFQKKIHERKFNIEKENSPFSIFLELCSSLNAHKPKKKVLGTELQMGMVTKIGIRTTTQTRYLKNEKEIKYKKGMRLIKNRLSIEITKSKPYVYNTLQGKIKLLLTQQEQILQGLSYKQLELI